MDNPSQTKADRLMEIELLLLDHPEGLTPAEIARRLGVNRSTIGRYYPNLRGYIQVDPVSGRWQIDRAAYPVHVRFTLHEALAVHLAARLLATRMERQNPHAAAALRKLGLSLQRLAPFISTHLAQSASVMDDAARHRDPRYLHVLETLTLAWAQGRKVRVWHRTEPGAPVFEYLFAPYFIEPYAVGQSTHVIGLREPPGKLRTFKIERIEHAELTSDPYTLPPGFDPRDVLADAWGIWYTEGEPQTVTLRFHPRAAARVRETRWHASETLTDLPDGSLLWSARVAEPREMLPWVRGWGADVEVLEPPSLREALRREAHRLYHLYQAGAPTAIPPYFHLWAKAEKSFDPETHPLLYHLIDVAECALALWEKGLSPQARRSFAQTLALSEPDAGQLLAFWAALHDLGKAAPGFQRKYPPALPNLLQAGFTAPQEAPSYAPHGLVSAWALPDLLTQETGLPRPDAAALACALGGHHGAWPTPDHFMPSHLKSTDKGDAPWDAARRALFQALKAHYRPNAAARLPTDPAARNAFLTLFSGFVSVADWIGSMTQFFPFTDEYLAPAEYAARAARQAAEALQALGWGGWQAEGRPAARDRKSVV